jgi:hypothetical protein
MTATPPFDMPQTPSGGQIFLDHVGWFVPDIEEAGGRFERLGFVLTPFVAQHNADPAGGPPRPAGTGNRCAMLRRGYLEILSAVPPVDTPLAAQLRGAVDRYTGVHLIAFTVADAEGAHARLEAAGFAPPPPVHLRRPVALPDGNAAEVAFTVIRVPPEAMAEGRIQILRQETPDLVWQDHLLARDNAVDGLAGALLCVDDPAAVSERYARFTGRSAAGSGEYRTIDLDRGRLAFAAPDRCRALLPGVAIPATPFIAAIALRCRDLEALRRLCAERSIRLLPSDDGTVRVAPSEAVGAALVVFGPAGAWPPMAEGGNQGR